MAHILTASKATSSNPAQKGAARNGPNTSSESMVMVIPPLGEMGQYCLAKLLRREGGFGVRKRGLAGGFSSGATTGGGDADDLGAAET